MDEMVISTVFKFMNDQRKPKKPSEIFEFEPALYM